MFQEISCIIVDDDAFIQELLKDKLNQYFPEIKIIATGNNGTEGLEKIKKFNPELVFLDVEMTDMTGFEMLSKLEQITFKTIFITSYKHYAIKAIRFNALDYLLKPFDLEELKTAVKRFKNNHSNSDSISNVSLALSNLNSKPSKQIITLRTQQGELNIMLKDITYIEGDRNYSYIYLAQNGKELVSKTLANLEELLDDKGFFRSHKSYIINRSHINKSRGQSVVMSNNIVLPISRRRKEDFLTWYNNEVE